MFTAPFFLDCISENSCLHWLYLLVIFFSLTVPMIILFALDCTSCSHLYVWIFPSWTCFFAWIFSLGHIFLSWLNSWPRPSAWILPLDHAYSYILYLLTTHICLCYIFEPRLFLQFAFLPRTLLFHLGHMLLIWTTPLCN